MIIIKWIIRDFYNEVKDEVAGFLKSIGYKMDKIPFIPTSALDAANLKHESCPGSLTNLSVC